MKFAIIGCQHAHGSIFMEEMRALGHSCIGIYDPEPDVLARAFADKYGAPLADGPEKLLQEAEVIGCASVNADKIGVLELCESYGKPVMLDKPAVASREGYERLAALLQRGRIEVGMLLTERFRPSIVTLKRLIAEGRLGELVHIGMRKPHRLNPARRPAWFFDKERCGGVVIDLFIHDFDLLRWLTGREVEASTGMMGKRILPEHPTFYDWASAEVAMAGGVGATLYADWHTPGKSWTWGDGRLFVTGTEGFAELRLEGDPLVGGESQLFLVTGDSPLQAVPHDTVTETVTGDFLRLLAGGVGTITHQDILAATRATIEADENARFIR